jgi:hypothetical protein
VPFGCLGAGDLVRDRHRLASLFAGDDIARQLRLELYWLLYNGHGQLGEV